MLQFNGSNILIMVAMLLALLFALFVYYKDSRFKDASTFTRLLLVFLRFISLAIILLFLFNPKWVKTIKRTDKPILVFLQDASSSIKNYKDSLFYQTNFLEIVEKNNQLLEENYEVYEYNFVDSIYAGLNNKYTGKYTNISNALQSTKEQFDNRNLAGVILASDGNYNKGLEPSYFIDRLNVPIFTLALGDSTSQLDHKISKVNFNKIAYLGNEFPVKIELLSNFDSEEKEHLKIIHKGKIIYEKWVNLKANTPIAYELLLDANSEGIQYYDISISSFTSEKNTDNNSFKLSIEILNTKQNILLIAASPHPDIAALKSALERGENYKVKTVLLKDFKEQTSSYNLIILHQLPEQHNKNSNVLSKIVASKTSLLYITGSTTEWKKFNELQNLISVSTSRATQEVHPQLNENFTPFNFSDNAIEFIRNAPPLLTPFGDVARKNTSQTLFTQNIEGIETQSPLLLFSENETNTQAILLAEGLWKWRLFDYQKNKTHDNFNEIIQSISQYLTQNKDKRKLRLDYSKISTQGDKFELKAQFYNDNYQRIEKAELNLVLEDENGNEFLYNLRFKGENYSSILSNLDPGKYKFTLRADYKKESIEQSGRFAIMPSTLEKQKTEANWNLLKKISDLTEGRFIEKVDFNKYPEIIESEIGANTETYFSKQLSDLIQEKAIFFLLLLSLFSEWTIRKSLGTH